MFPVSVKYTLALGYVSSNQGKMHFVPSVSEIYLGPGPCIINHGENSCMFPVSVKYTLALGHVLSIMWRMHVPSASEIYLGPGPCIINHGISIRFRKCVTAPLLWGEHFMIYHYICTGSRYHELVDPTGGEKIWWINPLKQRSRVDRPTLLTRVLLYLL